MPFAALKRCAKGIFDLKSRLPKEVGAQGKNALNIHEYATLEAVEQALRGLTSRNAVSDHDEAPISGRDLRMYCNKCGAQQPQGAAYCFSCGTRLNSSTSGTPVIDLGKKKSKPAEKPVEQIPTVLPSVLLSKGTPSANPDNYRYPESKPSFFSRNGSWFALAFLVLLIVGGVYAWNQYRSHIGEQAAKFRADAEAFAINGDYAAARDSLQQASALNRDETSIDTDLGYVEKAERIQDELQQVGAKLESEDLSAAEKLLEKIETELGERSSVLLDREKAAFLRQKDLLTVLRTAQEAQGLNNVTALAPLLDKIERIDTTEAEEVRAMIVQQIVEVSSKQANSLLQNQSFASATQAVEQGLNYAPADSGLLALNGMIESEKAEAENRKKAEEAQAAEAKRLAEAEETRRVEQAAAQEQAEYTVQAFYGNISMQYYSDAYDLLGSRWQKGTGYSDFVTGYDNTYSVWIDSINSVQSEDNVEVTVFLTAWESSEYGMTYSTYRSVYQVGYENGTMKILSGKGEKLS